MASTQYNRSIRKLVIAFGNLFNNLTLVRYNKDLSEQERLLVPISYAPKELYVRRLEFDPDLDKKVQITLPRMSFEMSGLTYDISRKLNTNIKNYASTASGVVSQYNPVPYNFDFNLYLYVRNIEDGTQLLEKIVSNFTPDYTLRVDMIPEMNTVKDVPIILNSATHDTIYEGNRDSETRVIIWTLNFTIKGYIFGDTTSANLITHSITTVFNKITPQDTISFTVNPASGNGDFQLSEVVYQGYSLGTAIAIAKVTDWSNTLNKLTVTDMQGNFTSSQKIIGTQSTANYFYTSYSSNVEENKFVKVDIKPDPLSANATSAYTANIAITEYPG